MSVVKVDSSCQVSMGRNPSARAAVAQLQDAIKKQELGVGLAALPKHVLAGLSQDVDKLTRGLAPGGSLLSKQFCKIT